MKITFDLQKDKPEHLETIANMILESSNPVRESSAVEKFQANQKEGIPQLLFTKYSQVLIKTVLDLRPKPKTGGSDEPPIHKIHIMVTSKEELRKEFNKQLGKVNMPELPKKAFNSLLKEYYDEQMVGERASMYLDIAIVERFEKGLIRIVYG